MQTQTTTAPLQAPPATATSTGPRTYPVPTSVAPTALVVFCADPRFHDATERFVDEELGLHRHAYLPLEIPGGVASLTLTELPKEAKYVREAITFYLDHFQSINKVVLINHEDCRKYKALQEQLPRMTAFVRNLAERQHLDLVKVAELVLGLVSRHVTVERYYARFANAERTQITFDKK